jgi:hypothetical protein
MIIVILVLIVLALFNVVFLAYLFDIVRNGLAPNVATPESALGQLSEVLVIKNDDQIMEIGCGDARLIRYCANKYPQAKFIGLDNGLIAIARAKLGSLKNKNVTIEYGNLTKLPKLTYNKYYVYLLPEALEIIRPKLPKGSLVVSLEYRFKDIKPYKIIKLKKQTHLVHKIYIYKF